MKVHILHENPEWLPPYQRELDRLGIPHEDWFIQEGHFDLDAAPPDGVYLNRMSPSAHTRGHRESVDFTRELLVWLESHGRRVINGSSAFALEVSKVRQYAALREAGIATPRTITVIGGPAHLKEAARRIPTPLIAKHNRGGSGASVRLFDTHEEYDAFVDSPEYEAPTDHVTLIQQYIKAPEPRITRVEMVDGEFLFAMNVETSHGFDLCPADPCGNGAFDGACPARDERSERFTLREEVDGALVRQYAELMRRHRIDIAGIEFIEDASGRLITYDINGTTNYSQHVARRYGVDGMGAVIRLLARSLEEQDGTPLAVA